MFDWEYYTLRNGKLYTEDNLEFKDPYYPKPPKFKTIEQAEQWLVDNDIRGNVAS